MRLRFLSQKILIGFYFIFHVAMGFADSRTDLVSEVQSFLSRFPIVRVGITEGPGNGHESAGATVVTRLREIGYQGEIEVVYTPNTADKLVYLLPPFKGEAAGMTQEYPDQHLKFINGGTEFKKLNLDYVPLAIMGADDLETQPKNLNAETLLRFQPLDWWRTPSLFTKKRDIENNLIDTEITLEEFKTLGFVFSPPNPPDIDKFLKQQLDHDDFKAKFPFLKQLLSSEQFRDILPIYGHGVRRGSLQLEFIVSALLRAGLDDVNVYKNGIVIPVINELFPLKINELKEMIAHTLYRKNFPVEFYNFDDPTLLKTMSQRDDKRIIIVNLGPIPKQVFEYIYLRETLPGLVEGVNSINYMKLIGKPYLPSSDYEGFHFANKDHKDILTKEENLLYLAWHEVYSVPGNTVLKKFNTLESIQNFNLANFYLQSRSPDGFFWSYFKKHQKNNDSEDQFLLGILKYKKHLAQLEAPIDLHIAKPVTMPFELPYELPVELSNPKPGTVVSGGRNNCKYVFVF